MVWEGIELLPVVNEQRKLLGVISRQDVIKSLQYMTKQPQVRETIHDLIFQGFSEVRDKNGQVAFRGMVTPQMTDSLGTLSTGVLTALITEAANRVLRRQRRSDLVSETLTIYLLKPVQLESEIELVPRILEMGRKFAKVDMEVYHEDQLVSKALVSAQVFER
jgi:predicted transcriptional regulator